MTFTDQCDLFGAIHEQGINLVVQHIMCQRPSPTTPSHQQTAAPYYPQA